MHVITWMTSDRQEKEEHLIILMQNVILAVADTRAEACRRDDVQGRSDSIGKVDEQ